MYKNFVDKIYSILEFENKIVGIKLLKNESEYQKIDAVEPLKEMNYCGMVKSATNGHSIKAKEIHFKCKSAPRVIGINPDDKNNSKGEVWNKLGLYCNSKISESVRNSLTYYTPQDKCIGIQIAPIELFHDIPDVILFLTTSYNSMRLIQGYSYYFGTPEQLQIIGNQAICYESTARVLFTKDINVSFLCIGTRHRAKWDDNLMCVGIYGEKFEKVVDGVFNTINPMESNKNKNKIKKKLEEKKIDSNFILYDDNYYKKV